MGEEADRLDPNPACAWRLARAWCQLHPAFRPKHPADLLRILKDVYQFPYPEHISADAQALHTIAEIDETYDAVTAALDDLAAALTGPDQAERLRYALEGRIAHRADLGLFLDHWHALEQFLAASRSLPQLKPSKRIGRPAKRPHLRAWITAICFYLINVEGETIKAGFDDESRSKGRHATLIRATLDALGISADDVTLETEIRHAKKRRDLKGKNFWEIIPLVPPALGHGDH